MKYRTEKDSLGEVKVPREAHYGAQTQRAIDNFQISGLVFSKDFITTLARIKMHAAKVNAELKLLDKQQQFLHQKVLLPRPATTQSFKKRFARFKIQL